MVNGCEAEAEGSGRDRVTTVLHHLHSQVPGLGHQVSGSGVQHQGQVQARTSTRTQT